MNLEESIKDVIQMKLTDGTVENIIVEKLEKGIREAMDDLFKSYGDVGKVVKNKAREIFVPAIEQHDFSEYVIKLDTVLSEIINSTALIDNKKILENFKELMIEDESKKEIKTSELFEEWCKHVAANVSTSGLEVDTDDEPTYCPVECSMTVEYEDGRSWSDYKKANVVFECEHDEDMNFIIPIHRWEKYDGVKWTIDYKADPTIQSLRYMDDFEIFLSKLQRLSCKLVIDDEECDDEVAPDKEPDVDFM